MKASWRKKASIFISLVALVLVIVSCRALPTEAVGTLSAAEIESMVKRVAPAQSTSREPELPRLYLNTTYAPLTGKTIAVAAGGDLQAAINSAQPGDTITLQAGATFTGNFSLPPKSGNGWIIIRTSTPDAALPPPGTRVSPANASLMAKILSPNREPALTAESRSHHYRLIGLEFGLAPGVTQCFSLIKLGQDETTVADLPRDLILDRLYIHGEKTVTLRRGIQLNSASTAIIDCYISDCHEVGADSQAIGGWNGAGPFKINNNYLEGAGENIIFGGADPTIPNLVPSDIEFRLNYCFKPLSWRIEDPSYAGTPWGVKNIFELKNAQRVLVDGNIFEHNWTMAQNGIAILFTVRNQDGTAPWSVVQDVTFTNNIIRRVASGFNLLGTDDNQPSQQTRRIRISNNLLEEVDGEKWSGGGIGFQFVLGPKDVIVENNTIFHTGNIIVTGSPISEGLIFRNNIFPHNEYGIKGDNRETGNQTITTYFPDSQIKKNAFVGGNSAIYPADNFFPASLDDVRFINRAAGNYRLAANSPFKAAGTNGLDLGVDFNLLNASIAGTASVSSVSAASYSTAGISPDSIASTFGTGLASSTLASSSVPLPSALLGSSVRILDSTGTERLSPLFLVSPTQINFLVPAATTVGTARVSVVNGTNTVSVGIAPIVSVSPGIFSVDSTGRGLPTANVLRVKSNGALTYETVARFDSSQNRFVAVPIDLGPETDQVFLILYGTGIRGNQQLSAVSATIGGVAAPVTFSGRQDSLVGVDQVNVRLPRTLVGRGDVDLVLSIAGKSANTVRINVK